MFSQVKRSPLRWLGVGFFLLGLLWAAHCSPPPPRFESPGTELRGDGGREQQPEPPPEQPRREDPPREPSPEPSEISPENSPDPSREPLGDSPAEGIVDRPPGSCASNSDCTAHQVCDTSLGRCFADCVTGGAVCFQGDRCDPARRRCLCDPGPCKAAKGWCDPRTSLCRFRCTTDDDCPSPQKCQQQRCQSLPDGGPTERPPRIAKGDDCSQRPQACDIGLVCVQTNAGPEVCLRPCQKETDCQAPEKCKIGALSNNRGLCALLLPEGSACSTAKSRLCLSGFRCLSGFCSRRTNVGVYDQCDKGHFCTPTTLVCVSFGAAFGSLCLKPCTVGKAGDCSLQETCLASQPGSTQGVCMLQCKKIGDPCAHPFLSCNQISSGDLVCVPQGKKVDQPAGAPCGGPYGTCKSPATCQVLFPHSQIGVCALPCTNNACSDPAYTCAQVSPQGPRVCLRTCQGVGATCPTGFYCSPIHKGWICAP